MELCVPQVGWNFFGLAMPLDTPLKHLYQILIVRFLVEFEFLPAVIQELLELPGMSIAEFFDSNLLFCIANYLINILIRSIRFVCTPWQRTLKQINENVAN